MQEPTLRAVYEQLTKLIQAGLGHYPFVVGSVSDGAVKTFPPLGVARIGGSSPDAKIVMTVSETLAAAMLQPDNTLKVMMG